MKTIIILYFSFLFLAACGNTQEEILNIDSKSVTEVFQGKINLGLLPNYANQTLPNYVRKDNTTTNPITDKGAILGRVLFYDKNLSANNTISCASCHQQAKAISDLEIVSKGVNGTTGRHSMRLINSRFSQESRFFWDERANTLEEQTTQPIKDHVEMAFSGTNGDMNFNNLIAKLYDIGYYKELFKNAYGSDEITEAKIQNSIAQFIRSIQSFDSKYDEGRAQVNNDNQPFPNFTVEENQGKQLFIAAPRFDNNGSRIDGGLGCGGCHRAPEFDIDPNSRNNGVTTSANVNATDLNNTKSPTIRDLFNQEGNLNGPLMHNGQFSSFATVLAHYDNIEPSINSNLDNRLAPNRSPQKLNMTEAEKNAITAFVKTLSGKSIYSNEKWSDPFPN